MKFLDYIQGYRKGKEANDIEQKSLTDPFLYDAIDGYDTVEGNHLEHIAEMQTRVKNKYLPSRSKRILRILVAAVIFFAIFGGYLFISEDNNYKNLTAYLDIAAEKNSEETQVAIAEKTENLVQSEETIFSDESESITQSAPIIDDISLESKVDSESATLENEKKHVHITSSASEEKNLTGLADKIITENKLNQISTDQALSTGLGSIENTPLKNKSQIDQSSEISLDEVVVASSINKKVQGAFADSKDIRNSVAGKKTSKKVNSEDSEANPGGNWFVGAGASATTYFGESDQQAGFNDRMTVSQNSISKESSTQSYMNQDNIADRTTVAESNSSKGSISQKAIPIIGQQNYNKYLRKSTKYPKEGTCSKVKGSVIVEFSITKTGRPINIRVVKPLCPELDQEAIRLVRSGSDWTISNTSVRLLIEFDGSKKDK